MFFIKNIILFVFYTQHENQFIFMRYPELNVGLRDVLCVCIGIYCFSVNTHNSQDFPRGKLITHHDVMAFIR